MTAAHVSACFETNRVFMSFQNNRELLKLLFWLNVQQFYPSNDLL